MNRFADPPYLVAITPGDHNRGRDLNTWLLEMAAAGLRAVIIREPHLEGPELDALVMSAWGSIPVVAVHERSAHARDFGLPVHLKADSDRRAPLSLWSQSCHSATEVDAAFKAGAWWTLLSPVWRPNSKPDDTRPPLGIDAFCAIAAGRPVLALGGVNTKRLRALRERGAWGAAVMGSIFDQPDPLTAARATEALLEVCSLVKLPPP